MLSLLLQPGLGLLDGSVGEVRVLAQELAHLVVHSRKGAVLWCDGDHGFNPYDLAELNLVRGFAADDGAERVLIKRCMTPFQWDTVLTQHVERKLEDTPTELVLALPYDRLFSTDELAPWEQADYVEFSLAHLRELARVHGVPVLLGIDLARWRRSHSRLSDLTTDAFDHRWSLGMSVDGSLLVSAGDRAVGRRAGRQTILPDFEPVEPVVSV